jgi:hypothetical protein
MPGMRRTEIQPLRAEPAAAQDTARDPDLAGRGSGTG